MREVKFCPAPKRAEDMVINCNLAPLIPTGWSIIRQITYGSGEWCFHNKLKNFQSVQQEKGRQINGYDLDTLVHKRRAVNATVLDFLLAHQELIPSEWKDMKIYFWGTKYKNIAGETCIRCLCWEKHKFAWGWYYKKINDYFDENEFVALAA